MRTRIFHVALFAAYLGKPDEGTGSAAAEQPKTLKEALAALDASQQAEQAAAQKATSAEAAAATAKADADQARAQMDAAVQAASESKAAKEAAEQALKAEQTAHAGTQAELATAKADLTKSAENVTRLEALCGVKGIDSARAVPQGAESEHAAQTVSQSSFDERLKAEKDPAKRKAIMDEFSKAVKEGRVK